MVKGFIGPAGTGKTKELIQFAEKTGATIVCEDVERMLGKIHGYEKVGIPVISYTDFMVLERDPSIKYVVDELENLFELMDITGFTFIQ